MSRESQAIYDPIYGAIYPDDFEWLLIKSRPLQRLRGIKQLGLVDIVYPGANHTRLEHSIGTMHMAGLIAGRLGFDEFDVRKARIAGLLHDLGHPALSHAVEGVLGRNPGIQPLIGGKRISRHEDFTHDAITRHPFGDDAISLADRDLGDADALFKEVADIAVGRRPPLGQIVSGDIDADRIDFLLRDSHHCGVSLGLIDADQVVHSLACHKGRIVLACGNDYESEMSRTAAESMLIARAHHYNALIHNPQVQSIRAMLLAALEVSLAQIDVDEARSRVLLFFKEYTDPDLLRFIFEAGDDNARELLNCIKYGRVYPLVARFDHKHLEPGLRMALSTISRSERARKLFEDGLGKKYRALVDISVGSGVPKSMRTEEESFLYDESSLAAGLVKSITRQISLSFFSDNEIDVSPEDVRDQAFRLLNFIREESYLTIDGLMIVFFSLHKILSETFGERILVPKVRNITWLYRTVSQLKSDPLLSGLYDYSFHLEYGFPYSEKLFEDIQILVAMGMIYQDLRHFEHNGRWLQHYEYMLTAEGLSYAGGIVSSYKAEAEAVDRILRMEKHTIPYDMVSLLLKRYMGERQRAS